jgi:hypothetical protein
VCAGALGTGRGRRFGPISVQPVAIPAYCIDGFLGAYWRRPHAYLDAQVRAGMSTFVKISRLKDGLESLRSDLDSGVCKQRYGHLLNLDELDIGYRLVVRHCGAGELPDSGR